MRTSSPESSPALDGVRALADAAEAVDHAPPLNDQAWADLRAGRADLLLLDGDDPRAPRAAAALTDDGFELVVAPPHRGRGLGADLVRLALARVGDAPLAAWAHGDLPGARALARRFGFAPARTLLRLRRALTDLDTAPVAAPGDTVLAAFRPGIDEAAWLRVNARAFAFHPEQGRMTLDDLAAREREPWFSADDFRLLWRDEAARRDAEPSGLLGFCWQKRDPAAGEAEIYVIGVDPDAVGRGLGGVLMRDALAHARRLGDTASYLYVEGDNDPAIRLYSRLGYQEFSRDVRYVRGKIEA